MTSNLELTPPCQAHCPLEQSGRDYLRLVAQGRLDEAFHLVYRDNPLPASCGRICHKCEPFCNRGEIDAPVRVATIKSFLADRYYKKSEAPAKASRPGTGKRVAVVGSGPAGLAASRALAKLGHRVTIFEALPVAGGQLAVGVPQHRLPLEVVQVEVERLTMAGVELRLSSPVDDVEGLFSDGYRAVLVATGSHLPKPHPAVEMGRPGVLVNTEFLRDAKLGIPIRLGRRILVIGGGNVAMDCARVARRLGLPGVTVSCVESAAEMPAHPHEVRAAVEEGIEIRPATTVLSISHDAGDRITGVALAPITSLKQMPGSAPEIEYDAAQTGLHPCDTVLLAIGQTPQARLVSRSAGVSLASSGAIIVQDGLFSTGREGLFAVGDAVTVIGSVAGAIGAGNRAAAQIHEFLTGTTAAPSLAMREPAAFDPEQARKLIRCGLVSAGARLPLRELTPYVRIRDMARREVDLGMDEAQAIAEAKRCLGCGNMP